MKSAHIQPTDLDGYNMTMLPESLLGPFGADTLVTLSSYAPKIRDDPEYTDWVYVATAVQYFKIEPEFKAPLFDYLEGYVAVAKTDWSTSLIQGKQSIHLSRLVEGLACTG
ncbi:hypothetical protein CBOM_06357 [Ceraceosorus bombacis]|uniref:Uncharacterized protein n=1 Tax=Ceraceosorus bombacis TaxID=401625 RepID=A0A0P1A3D0_9BASI|nr:hypothetical protein CBOM_06357 [Ceraceosorus bombacis]